MADNKDLTKAVSVLSHRVDFLGTLAADLLARMSELECSQKPQERAVRPKTTDPVSDYYLPTEGV